MLAMSYDAALRGEEICSLEVADIDPAHRLLRIRLEVRRTDAKEWSHTRWQQASCSAGISKCAEN